MTTGRRRFRLAMGMARLEDWAASAGQIDKNAVYKALFAISDGSVFQAHKVLDDVHRPHEFFIIVRDDLVIKIRYYEMDTFGILYIGPISDTPDLEAGLDKSA